MSNPPPGLCEQCRQPSRDRIATVTGRLLCPDCADTVTAGTASLMTGGGTGEAAAIRGWLRRIRLWTKPTGSARRPQADDGDPL